MQRGRLLAADIRCCFVPPELESNAGDALASLIMPSSLPPTLAKIIRACTTRGLQSDQGTFCQLHKTALRCFYMFNLDTSQVINPVSLLDRHVIISQHYALHCVGKKMYFVIT